MPTGSLQRGKTPPNEANCWSWVATSNIWGRDPGSWAFIDSATKVVTWLTTFHLGPYWDRAAVKEAWSIGWSCHTLTTIRLTVCKQLCPDYDTEQHLMVRFHSWGLGVWSTPSLSLRSRTLWPGMALPVKVTSMDQIELFNHLLRIIIIIIIGHLKP